MTNTSDIDLTQPVDSTAYPDFEWSAACEVLLGAVVEIRAVTVSEPNKRYLLYSI